MDVSLQKLHFTQNFHAAFRFHAATSATEEAALDLWLRYLIRLIIVALREFHLVGLIPNSLIVVHIRHRLLRR